MTTNMGSSGVMMDRFDLSDGRGISGSMQRQWEENDSCC